MKMDVRANKYLRRFEWCGWKLIYVLTLLLADPHTPNYQGHISRELIIVSKISLTQQLNLGQFSSSGKHLGDNNPVVVHGLFVCTCWACRECVLWFRGTGKRDASDEWSRVWICVSITSDVCIRHAILASDCLKMFFLIEFRGVALLCLLTAERGSCQEYREGFGGISSPRVTGAFEFLIFAGKYSVLCVLRKSGAFGSHIFLKCVMWHFS